MHTRIKIIRETFKLTQSKFGESLGASRNTITNIENNRVIPKPYFITHICDVYNINETWLRTGTGPMFICYNIYDEALGILKQLKPELQEYALKQLRDLLNLQNTLNQK